MGNALDANDVNQASDNSKDKPSSSSDPNKDAFDKLKKSMQPSMIHRVATGLDKLDIYISQKIESLTLSKQRFRYLVVLDFEATCGKNASGKTIKRREIIEWAAM
eukprot:267124_1